MIDVICLQINAWFLENRDPETGEYPDFPDDTDAGSKVILNPPLLPPPPAPAADGKKGAKKAPEKPKGKGKGKGKHYHSLLVHAVLLLCDCVSQFAHKNALSQAQLGVVEGFSSCDNAIRG